MKTIAQDKQLGIENTAPSYREDITGFLNEISMWAWTIEEKQNQIIAEINKLSGLQPKRK